MNITANPNDRHIYTVGELTDKIKGILENKFPFIWISGEISNLRIPRSGHLYFSLKDENAQISAVMFRNQQRNLKFNPEDGLRITGLGRISVYQPRGTYQIILEYMEPKGIGALQKSFEQLKQKLDSQGLFDPIHKKPIPFLPGKISVITSATGAAVQDIINVIHRRHPQMAIEVLPCSVQGDNAPFEIEEALAFVNETSNTNLIILARGGGSIEDLWAFNTEEVARAIFNSNIPVISAVGHETDFTIADFVADLRAPTPSAAAELSTPDKDQLVHTLDVLIRRMNDQMVHHLDRGRHAVAQVSQRLVHPRKRLEDTRLHVDDLQNRAFRAFTTHINQKEQNARWFSDRLLASSPKSLVYKLKGKLELNNVKLHKFKANYIDKKQWMYQQLVGKLNALDPESILKRGYSITKTIPQGKIIKTTTAVGIGQEVEIKLSQGALVARVTEIEADNSQ